MIDDVGSYPTLTDLARTCASVTKVQLADRDLIVADAALERGAASFVRRWQKGLDLLAARSADSELDVRWPQVIVELPEFARLVQLDARRWINQRLRIAERLSEDRRELPELDIGTTTPVTSMREVAGYTWPDGLAVMRVSDGIRDLYFKPRDLRAEQAVCRLVGRIGEKLGVPLRVQQHIPRDGYGWVTGAREAQCASVAQVRMFYVRMGIYLAIAYSLGAHDLHGQNFVAVGPQPVLIDAETVVAPRAIAAAATIEYEFDGPGHTAGDTLILPRVSQRRSRDAHARSSAALSGVLSHPPAVGCQPILDGRRMPAHKYIREVISGFRMAADWISADGYPVVLKGVAELDSLPVRVMQRSVSDETNVLDQVWQPKYLQTFGDRWAAIARALPVAPSEGGRATAGANRVVEQVALANMLLPRFTAQGMANRVNLTGAPLSRSATPRAQRRLVETRGTSSTQEVLVRGSVCPPEVVRVPNLDEVLDQAARERLARSVIQGLLDTRWNPSAVRWLGVARDPDSHYPGVSFVGIDYFNGVAGIGVALLLTGRALPPGDPLQADASRAARECLRRTRQAAKAADDRRMPIGLDVGTAGLAIALSIAGDVLGDDELIRDARTFALATWPVAEGHRADLFGGHAGAALACLGVYSRTGDQDVASLVNAHLRACMAEAETVDGVPTWRFRGKVDTTWSHGSAGVSFAAGLCWAAGFRDDRVAEYLASQVNVLVGSDVRDSADLSLSHGAAGQLAATAALVGSGALGDSGQLVDTACALGRLLAKRDPGIDSLCCGSAGIAGALSFAASTVGGVAGDSAAAELRAGASSVRRAISSPLRLGGVGDISDVSPSLWTGVGGPVLALDDGEAGLLALCNLVACGTAGPVIEVQKSAD